MKVAVVTGANGKLAPFVINELKNRGYTASTVVGNLSNFTDAETAFDMHNYDYGHLLPVDLIHLVGHYEQTTPDLTQFGRVRVVKDSMDSNYYSLVAAVEYLRPRLKSFVFVTAAGGMPTKDSERAYLASKRAAEIYAGQFYAGSGIRGGIITPAWPIDSDDRRQEVAERLVDFTSVPTYPWNT